jgi:TrmH family RNA methyltransferase
MITSLSNPQIKRVIQLNTKAKCRREERCFAAEGIKLFRETPENLRDRVFVEESFARDPQHADLMEEVQKGAYEIVENRVFEKMCDTRTPQGILTVARMPSWQAEDLLGGGGECPLVMVLEDLQDPGNLGTILRTAEGAGVTGIFMSAKTADPFQPKVIRSTMGSIYRVPFLREEDLGARLDWLAAHGVSSYAAHLNGENSYNRENYTEGTAFLIGNEGNGLSSELSAKATRLIRIPMEGKVESLNAAVAAALLMYTAHGQRH